MEANMEGILGLIFIDFLSILRTKWGWKIDQNRKKSMPKRSLKMIVF